jgi:hypothetical protein
MNAFRRPSVSILPLFVALATAGCRSPYYADRGAGVGALGGAGVGAIVGNAVGDPVAGALIGAGAGALGGAAVGSAIDDVQAQNRAELAAVMGRQVPPGAATIEEVVAMTQQRVDPMLIQNYVRTSGMARPVTAQDLIYLQQAGVNRDVVTVMQTPPAPVQPAMVAQGPPVVVQEHYYHDPFYGPHFGYYHGPHHYHGCGPGPRVSWGVHVGH